MAILKVIAHGVRREAKRKVLQYVLDPQKTQEGLCCVTGDFGAEQITPKTVFQEFQRTRKLFGKDKKGSRTYLHGTVSFAPGELPPEQVTEFAAELVEQIYPGHQVLVTAHTDTAHPHAHFVVETVSYDNGTMLHTSKHDLERAKKLCEKMCIERGLVTTYDIDGDGIEQKLIDIAEEAWLHQDMGNAMTKEDRAILAALSSPKNINN